MYKTHFLNGNNESRLLYKKFANKLNKTKFAAKKRFLLQQFDQHESNPRKTWEVINSLLTKTKSKYSPTRIQVNDNVLDATSQIAENFNNYFCNIADNLMNTSTSNSISHSFVHHKKFLQKRVQESLFKEPTSPSEVYNAQAGLKTGQSSGLDNIPSFLLKIAAVVIAPTLSYFINLSFELGLFPESMKKAKIIPVFKTGDKLLMSNYRPISILSSFSKIFEKCIHKRLFSFFDKQKVLSPNQYGFRPGFNTTHAITDIVTTAYENMCNNHYTGLIFLDLKKAFGTVNHNVLLSKLNHYGIRGVAHNLLSSYLTNRKQSVTINNYCFTPLIINNGVPQGSTLGPLLFLIYINDLENSILTNPRLFADDTCICVNADTISNLEYLINSRVTKS